MRRSRVGALVAAVLTIGAVLAAAVAANAGPNAQAGLGGLRRATARYHDVDKATASRRQDLKLCFDHMGQHYADPNTIDGVVDPLNPEAMVYADDSTGHLRLVAVEWVATQKIDDVIMHQDLHFNPAVQLWVLHAWIWSPNPDGMFADMNPRIGNCPRP